MAGSLSTPQMEDDDPSLVSKVTELELKSNAEELFRFSEKERAEEQKQGQEQYKTPPVSSALLKEKPIRLQASLQQVSSPPRSPSSDLKPEDLSQHLEHLPQQEGASQEFPSQSSSAASPLASSSHRGSQQASDSSHELLMFQQASLPGFDNKEPPKIPTQSRPPKSSSVPLSEIDIVQQCQQQSPSSTPIPQRTGPFPLPPSSRFRRRSHSRDTDRDTDASSTSGSEHSSPALSIFTKRRDMPDRVSGDRGQVRGAGEDVSRARIQRTGLGASPGRWGVAAERGSLQDGEWKAGRRSYGDREHARGTYVKESNEGFEEKRKASRGERGSIDQLRHVKVPSASDEENNSKANIAKDEDVDDGNRVEEAEINGMVVDLDKEEEGEAPVWGDTESDGPPSITNVDEFGDGILGSYEAAVDEEEYHDARPEAADTNAARSRASEPGQSKVHAGSSVPVSPQMDPEAFEASGASLKTFPEITLRSHQQDRDRGDRETDQIHVEANSEDGVSDLRSHSPHKNEMQGQHEDHPLTDTKARNDEAEGHVEAEDAEKDEEDEDDSDEEGSSEEDSSDESSDESSDDVDNESVYTEDAKHSALGSDEEDVFGLWALRRDTGKDRLDDSTEQQLLEEAAQAHEKGFNNWSSDYRQVKGAFLTTWSDEEQIVASTNSNWEMQKEDQVNDSEQDLSAQNQTLLGHIAEMNTKLRSQEQSAKEFDIVLRQFVVLALIPQADDTSLKSKQRLLIQSSTVGHLVAALDRLLLNESIQAKGNTIILELVRVNEEMRFAFGRAGAIELLTRAIAKHMDSVLLADTGVQALHYLLCDKENRNRISGTTAIDTVVTTMNQHMPVKQIQQAGCLFLANCAYDHCENQQSCVDLGGVEAIIDAIAVHDEDEVLQRRGCMALRNFCVGSSEVKLRVIEKKGVAVVLEILNKFMSNQSVVEHAIMALYNMVIGAKGEGQKSLQAPATIKVLLEVMQVHVELGTLQGFILQMLQEALKENASIEPILSAGGVKAVLNVMKRHVSKRKILGQGSKILCQLGSTKKGMMDLQSCGSNLMCIKFMNMAVDSYTSA